MEKSTDSESRISLQPFCGLKIKHVRNYVQKGKFVFLAILMPVFGPKIHVFIVIPPTIAEISMVLYLLLVGVRMQKPLQIVP